jgi:integrase
MWTKSTRCGWNWKTVLDNGLPGGDNRVAVELRHSFAALLKANGEEVKVAQESLHHANSRITPDVSTQGLMPTKRQAQGRMVKSLLAPRRQRRLLQVLENKL